MGCFSNILPTCALSINKNITLVQSQYHGKRISQTWGLGPLGLAGFLKMVSGFPHSLGLTRGAHLHFYRCNMKRLRSIWSCRTSASEKCNPKLGIHRIPEIKDSAQWMWHGSAVPAEEVSPWGQLWELWELLAKLRTATEAALTFLFQLFLLCPQSPVSLFSEGARGDHPLSAWRSRGEHCTIF